MKKFIGIALIVVAAVTASWNFSLGQNEIELSDLALANVEALARKEDPWAKFRVTVHDLHSWTCYEGGISYCPL